MGKRTKKILLTIQARGGYKDKQGNLYTEQEAIKLLIQNKATTTKWHGRGKPKISYEGEQYRGGRKEKTPNLIKTETGFKNQYGVEFTREERKKLDNMVNKSNRLRKKQIESVGALPRLRDGKPTGQTVADIHSFGTESDFIITRQSKSLQGFKTKEDYYKYLDIQSRIHSGEYLDDKTRGYKHNHMIALENVFGDEAKDVIMKIRMMKPEEYRRYIEMEETLEISYIYEPSHMTGKLNQIRRSLKMRTKDE